MVYMSMGKYYRVKLSRVEGKLSVQFLALFPAPLMKTAVQKDFVAVDLQQVLGTCNRLRCPIKSNSQLYQPPRPDYDEETDYGQPRRLTGNEASGTRIDAWTLIPTGCIFAQPM